MMATPTPIPSVNFDFNPDHFIENTSGNPAIRAGWWTELTAAQAIEREMTQHQFIKVIDDTTRSIKRANDYRAKGVMSEVEEQIVSAKAALVRSEFEAVKDRSAADQKQLARLEQQHFRNLAGGNDGIQTEAAAIAEDQYQNAVANNMKSMTKAASDIKDSEHALSNLIDKRGIQFDEFEKASTAVDDLIAKGTATDAEMTAAIKARQTAFDTLNQLKNDETAAQLVFNEVSEAKQTIIRGLRIANGVLEDARTFSRGIRGTNWAIKGLSNAVGAYTDPLKAFAKDLTDVQELLFKSNEEFAKLAIQGGDDLIEFLAEVNRVTKEEVQKGSDLMKSQLAKVKGIINSETEEMTEEILAEVSKWMSPSWRLLAATKAEVWDLWNLVESNFLKRWLFRLVGFISLALNSVFKLSQALIYKLLEVTVGRITGTKAILAVQETIDAVISYKIASSASHLVPEVQVVLALGYAVWDWFQYHNKNFMIGDTIQFMTAGLVPMDGTLIDGYPKFSEPGKQKKGEDTGPEKMWELDHEELKTGLDFWGKHFVEMNAALHGRPKPSYKAYQDFTGITRVPGRYIDPNEMPLDTPAELEQCKQLEKSLDLGVIVDEVGRLTGVDKGGQLTNTLIPRLPGVVRNLVNFPLYETTITWPDRKGVFLQTKGDFTPENIDPGVVATFNYWVSTGQWGPAYTSPEATSKTRAVAKRTNLADLHGWLNPVKNNPFAWVDAEAWASGNVGKRSIIQQKMAGITLDVLKKEMITETSHKGGVPFVPDYVYEEKHNTLEYVNGFYDLHGRYPMTPESMEFYTDVIKNHKTTHYAIQNLGPWGGSTEILQRRDSTAAEIHIFTTVVNQIDLYMKALEDSQTTTQEAWDTVFKDTLWNAYLDATSPRTQWGYITKYKNLLIVELESNVSLMAGKNKNRLFQEFASMVGKVGLPLNTNRFNRVAFTAKLNQILYSNPSEAGSIEKQLEKTVGKILKNILITTGVKENETFAAAIKSIIKIENKTFDLPVKFGDIHCRIIVTEKPRPTCFVVFKGTTKFWEWVIDADFSGAEFSKIKSGKKKGTYKLVPMSKSEVATETVKTVLDSTDTFLIHRGYLRIWKVFQPQVEKALQAIYKEVGVEDVIVTGHGLGAAIAQIACLEISSNPLRQNSAPPTPTPMARAGGLIPIPPAPTPVVYRRPHAYMFASPPVGDNSFTWHFNAMTAESAQVYVDGDVATMVPPFLIPSSTYSGITGVTTIGDILALADSKELSGGWGLLNRLYKFSNLPQFDLRAFQTRDGTTDWKKVAGQGMSIANSLHDHRAVRGGGVFMVLSYMDSGHVDEFQADPGSSRASLDILEHATFDTDAVRARHELGNIIKKMEQAAKDHPDLFTEIADNKAAWDDTANIHTMPAFPDPPKLAVVHPKGKVIGFARTKKRKYPGSAVTMDEIHKDSIVLVPDMEEHKRNHQRRRRRLKTRKKTEGNYHGY